MIAEAGRTLSDRYCRFYKIESSENIYIQLTTNLVFFNSQKHYLFSRLTGCSMPTVALDTYNKVLARLCRP